MNMPTEFYSGSKKHIGHFSSLCSSQWIMTNMSTAFLKIKPKMLMDKNQN